MARELSTFDTVVELATEPYDVEISESTLRRWARSGCPHDRVKGRLRFDPVEVYAWHNEKRALAREICRLAWVLPERVYSRAQELVRHSREELRRMASYWRRQAGRP